MRQIKRKSVAITVQIQTIKFKFQLKSIYFLIKLNFVIKKLKLKFNFKPIRLQNMFLTLQTERKLSYVCFQINQKNVITVQFQINPTRSSNKFLSVQTRKWRFFDASYNHRIIFEIFFEFLYCLWRRKEYATFPLDCEPNWSSFSS